MCCGCSETLLPAFICEAIVHLTRPRERHCHTQEGERGAGEGAGVGGGVLLASERAVVLQQQELKRPMQHSQCALRQKKQNKDPPLATFQVQSEDSWDSDHHGIGN